MGKPNDEQIKGKGVKPNDDRYCAGARSTPGSKAPFLIFNQNQGSAGLFTEWPEDTDVLR